MIEQKSARAIGIALVAALMLPLLSNYALAYTNTVDAAPNAGAGEEWHVNMDNPSDDPNFKNVEEVKFTKQSDGSWQAGGKPDMRLEAWSKAGGWKNVEVTAHFKIVTPRPDFETKPIIQLYARGGHHSMDDPCLGSAYKARLYMDGHTTFVKEVNHPAYTDERGEAKATSAPLELGKWYGFKAIIYNIDNDSAVHMESYIDENDSGNWKLASVTEDHGGWSVNAANIHDYDTACGRAKDEVITKPGVLAAFRTDSGTVWDFKDLSVREIQPSATSSPSTTPQQLPSSNSTTSTTPTTTTPEDCQCNNSNDDNNSISKDDEQQILDEVKQCFEDNNDSNNDDELKKCLSDAIDQLAVVHSNDEDHTDNSNSDANSN